MISVIIPVLNESNTIATVVRYAKSQPGVTEIIVVDDGSTDHSPSLARMAGAKVITSSLLGKGASMSDGIQVAQNDCIVFLDGDLSGLATDLVDRLTKPILGRQASFVKASFSRSAGRVTTLTAKPLLKIFFPELAHLQQPLGGIVASTKSLLATLHLETDYGVDLGMLIDVQMMGERVVEVDVGEIQHDSQPLDNLSKMASQVIRTLFHRASRYDRFHIEQLNQIEEWERRSAAHLHNLPECLQVAQRIALIDMDGTLIRERFIARLADRIDVSDQLAQFLDHPKLHPVDRTRAIANLLQGVPMDTFVDVARQIELHDGAVELVRELRRIGYRVGIVTDSFRVAAETIRRRVFADFSFANILHFENGIATGDVQLCPTMFHQSGCEQHLICKKNVVLHLQQATGIDRKNLIAIGDGENDICMFGAVETSFAFQAKTSNVHRAATYSIDRSLMDVIQFLTTRVSSQPRLVPTST